MGDKNRFSVLADFIAARYPRLSRVADVAGGQGLLSMHLATRGATPTVIDPRRTDLPKNVRKAQRRGMLPPFARESRLFSHTDAEGYDLLIGLHPDGATAELATCADRRPVVIVPCCNYGWDMPGDPTQHVRALWERMGVKWSEEILPMSGRNLVMFTQ